MSFGDRANISSDTLGERRPICNGREGRRDPLVLGHPKVPRGRNLSRESW